jgi:hypothetical protein
MTLVAAATAASAADVGVSVTIGQPGFYGRIDIGNAPRPVLIYPQPVLVTPPPGVVPGPIYLRVPPGHAKNWRKYCQRYHACGRPAYFVQDGWYNDVYVPHYRERHRQEYRDREERRKSHGKGKSQGKRRDRRD